ncbi:Type 1 glutamine amidotransferase-like domain-containing protein [Patescibacteria group bacterium]
MKLLLTSAGISNKSIEDALQSLSEKPLKEMKAAFIPTAANWEDGEKSWMIKDLVYCNEKFSETDIVDISALPRKKWEPRLRNADLIMVEGGNTSHLMRSIEESGLENLLAEILKNKVYVGVSAGSIVMTPDLLLEESEVLYGENPEGWTESEGLSVIDFCVIPHYNAEYFPNINDENLEEISKTIKHSIYALDDNSAVKVVDGEVEVISEGEWRKF